MLVLKYSNDLLIKASIRLALAATVLKFKRGINNDSQIFSRCDHSTIDIVLSIAMGET